MCARDVSDLSPGETELIDPFPNPRDRLDLLSAFESVPNKQDTQGLFGGLLDLYGDIQGGLDTDLLIDLWRQVRLVENALGEEHDASLQIRADADRLRPAQITEDTRPFLGLSLLMVGGIRR